MIFSELENMDNKTLVDTLKDILHKEHLALCEVMQTLIIVYERQLFIELGYSTLFTFLHEYCGMSRNSAFKRAKATIAMYFFPALFSMLVSGKLSITHISIISSRITEANFAKVIEGVSGKSAREAERFMSQVDCEGNLLEKETKIELKLMISDSLKDKIDRVKEILARSLKPLTNNAVIEQIVDEFLEKHDPIIKAQRVVNKKKSKPSLPKEIKRRPSRHIPADIRSAVIIRDEGRCTFTSDDGKR